MFKRPSLDETGLRLATVWAERGTCARRKVGCVLMDARGVVIGAGYNGVAAGHVHCTVQPCRGASCPSGAGLDLCEAIHAEQNALIYCDRPRAIATAYVTVSPCIHCVKMLLNTTCTRVVFRERYAHDEAARDLWLWTRRQGEWLHLPG